MRLSSLDDAKCAPRGEHRAPCPMCDKGPRDEALGIKVDDLGIVWHCFRCEFTGASQHAQICAGSRSANLPNSIQRRDVPIGLSAPSRDANLHVSLSPWALAIWEQCEPLAGVAVAYLKARGCVIPPDGDLRWHPQLKNSAADYTGPALVGLVTDAKTCAPMTLHRTWINADGTKACEPARLLAAGHKKQGGVIRLWPDDCVTHGLAIAEGIETALTIAHEHTPVWSVIDAGNLRAFPLLDGIESLVIAADNDDVGIEAAKACAATWKDRDVRIAIPPRKGADWNDMGRAA